MYDTYKKADIKSDLMAGVSDAYAKGFLKGKEKESPSTSAAKTGTSVGEGSMSTGSSTVSVGSTAGASSGVSATGASDKKILNVRIDKIEVKVNAVQGANTDLRELAEKVADVIVGSIHDGSLVAQL
jgi:hypothetical protein